MEELLEWMEYIEDVRQTRKVRHKLKDILVIVLFATLANADDWVEMALFARQYQDYLRKYIGLENGIKRKESRPSHIVSAWSKEDGFCLGQKAVEEKSNEITAIPELLERIRIKGQIITIDAMGTQKAIAEKIRGKRAEYVLALKRNQAGLYEDVELYFRDEKLREKIRQEKNYACTIEKAHGQIEKREYYQTEDIGWMPRKKEWKGLKSIVMEEKTIRDEKGERKENRYYLSSLGSDIETLKRAIRGHWSIESMHWHLDVTFREDANTTLDKQAAQNQNIIRKWSLSILKTIELLTPGLSMKKKRYMISLCPIQYLEEVLSL